MNLHRLRLSAWSERMYLKYNRPHCTFFGYIPGFGPQKRSKAPFGGASRSIFAGSERRCADTAKWRAFRTFRPTVAPNWTPQSGNKAGDPLTQSDRFRNVRWITRPPQGARSVGIALSWCRWTPTTALPMALLAQSRGPKPGKYPKNVQETGFELRAAKTAGFLQKHRRALR